MDRNRLEEKDRERGEKGREERLQGRLLVVVDMQVSEQEISRQQWWFGWELGSRIQSGRRRGVVYIYIYIYVYKYQILSILDMTI